jgi:hypothetical protein
MVLRSIAILLVGTALGAGVQYVAALNRTSPSVDTSGIASSSNLHRESTAAVTAESFLAADRLPPAPLLAALGLEATDIVATCAGSMDANGMECDNGLQPTPVLMPATKPRLDRRPGSALANAGAAIVKPFKVATSAGEQTNPENRVVGCVGGADSTGNDCM